MTFSPAALGPNVGIAGFLEGNPVATFIIDSDHRVTCWNKACEALTGISAAALIGTSDHWRAFYPTERPVMVDLILDGCPEDDIHYFYQDKFRRSELIPGAFEAEDFFADFGTAGRWLFFTAAPVRDAEGRVIGGIETLQDITERRLAEAALRENEAFLAQVIDSNSVATLVIDRDHRVTHWNRACEALTGVTAENVLLTRDRWRPAHPEAHPSMSDLLLDGVIETDFKRFYFGDLQKSALIDGAFEAEEFCAHFGEGGKWLFITAAPLLSHDGEVIGAIETIQDVTERRNAEENLRQSEALYRKISVTDSLTELYNARHFHAILDQELIRAARYRRPLSLMILDIDDFKQINDSYGHAEGDRILQILSGIIQSSLRGTDTAYRYGGEEFAVLMPEVAMDAGAIVGERVRKGFSETVLTLSCGTVVQASVSVGVTQYLPGDNAKSLFCRADDGMYQAKRRGKNCVVIVEAPSGP